MARVMVVDDHPMWREGVARDLTEAGYEVVAAVGEGGQAVRLAPAVRPDVVVLDLQLPDLSGVEVIGGLIAVEPGRTGAGALGQRGAAGRARRGQGGRRRLPGEIGRPRGVPGRGAPHGRGGRRLHARAGRAGAR